MMKNGRPTLDVSNDQTLSTATSPAVIKESRHPYVPAAKLPGGLTWPTVIDGTMGPVLPIERDPFEDIFRPLRDLDDRPVLILLDVLKDGDRLTPFSEVPHAGKTLLTALKFALEHQCPLSIDFEALIELTAKARPVPMGEGYKTVEIRGWTRQIHCKPQHLHRVINSFGDGRIQSKSFTGRFIINLGFMATGDPFFVNGYSQTPEEVQILHYDDTSTVRPWVLQGKVMATSAHGSLHAIFDGEEVNIFRTDSNPMKMRLYDDESSDDARITSICFSVDEQLLASGHATGRVKLWILNKGKYRVILRIDPTHGHQDVYQIAFSDDGSKLAFCDGFIRVWDFKGDSTFVVDAPEYPSQLAWSPLGNKIASSTRNMVTISDITNPEATMQFKTHHDVLSIAFRSDGGLIACGSSLGWIEVWRCNTRQKEFQFAHHNGEPVFALAFSPDGQQVMAGGGAGHIEFWDVATGTTEPKNLETVESETAEMERVTSYRRMTER
ncbi:hypothetical protein ONZ45_g13874 [Pleurotus djamor]|nr:hypothetical protein ONZ45_g13874 [Pleurotus djamor]